MLGFLQRTPKVRKSRLQSPGPTPEGVLGHESQARSTPFLSNGRDRGQSHPDNLLARTYLRLTNMAIF